MSRKKVRRRCPGCRRACTRCSPCDWACRLEPAVRLMGRQAEVRIRHVFRPWGDEWEVSVVTPHGELSRAVGARLRHTLYEAMGRPQERRCAGPCGKLLPTANFNVNNANADGMETKCRACESRRKRKRSAEDGPPGHRGPKKSAAEGPR